MIYGGYQGNDTGTLISYEDAFKNLKDVHYVIIYISNTAEPPINFNICYIFFLRGILVQIQVKEDRKSICAEPQ